MQSHYVRELEAYSLETLTKSIFINVSQDEVIVILKKLKEYGLVKFAKHSSKKKSMDDLAYEDLFLGDITSNPSACDYVFKFVGLIVVGEHVIKCYPKYISTNTKTDGNLKIKEKLKTILEVIRKYKIDKKQDIQHIQLYDYEDGAKSSDLISIMMSIIDGYSNNGVYMKEQMVLEINGKGEILWDRTINNTVALIRDNRYPYYFDLFNRSKVNDEQEYIKRLHECILTKCSEKLKAIELSDFLNLPEIQLSDAELEEFGDKDYILYRLDNEIRTQFNTEKQFLLKLLYAYVYRVMDETDNDEIFLSGCNEVAAYGTNSFNLVWEAVCAGVFGDQRHWKIKNIFKDLHIANEAVEKYKEKYLNGSFKEPGWSLESELIDIVEKPEWHIGEKKCYTDTFIPDFLSILMSDDRATFVIYDAKYYLPSIENEKLYNAPGIESISKQYIYELAYREFLDTFGIKDVLNVFLYPAPSELNNLEKAGALGKNNYVYMKMFDNVELKCIRAVYLNPETMYEDYLLNKVAKLDEHLVKKTDYSKLC